MLGFAIIIIATDYLASKIIRRKGCDDEIKTFINIWATLVQVGGMPRHSSTSIRPLWISWIVSSLVLSTGYLSALKSFRTAPNIEFSLKNLENVA